MKRTRLPRWGSIAGIVVGLALSGALVATGALTLPVRRDPRDASEEFLRAWERSRRGTFVVESQFRRRLSDGRTLFSASRLVQRPPDRLIRQFGGIDGTINGHLVVCSTDQGNNFSCFAGSQVAPDYDATVRHELDVFRSYFTRPAPPGSTPGSAPTGGTAAPATGPAGTAAPTTALTALGLYRVGHAPEPGCFEFFQRIRYPDAPYGTYAKFCFDDRTGAMRSFERHLADGVVETLAAQSTVAQVTEADFDTAQNPAFDLRMDLGAFPAPTAPPTSEVAAGDPSATSTTLDPARSAQLRAASNRDLIVEGSRVLDDPAVAGPYVDEAIVRLGTGQLSINDPDWLDGANAQPLLRPVVLRLLALGVYLPPG